MPLSYDSNFVYSSSVRVCAILFVHVPGSTSNEQAVLKTARREVDEAVFKIVRREVDVAEKRLAVQLSHVRERCVTAERAASAVASSDVLWETLRHCGGLYQLEQK